jgi:hypothetical protein
VDNNYLDLAMNKSGLSIPSPVAGLTPPTFVPAPSGESKCSMGQYMP